MNKLGIVAAKLKQTTFTEAQEVAARNESKTESRHLKLK